MSSLVPEGWVSTTIGEATSEISDGGTPATSNAEYFNGSIPWVVIDDIQPRIVHTKSSITELGLQKSSAKLWDKGTIILSTGATIGEVGIAMKAMATKQGICGVVVKSDVSAKYFYHLLVSKKRQLNILSQGSTIKETRPPTVKKIQICLPPLPEQKKIASILTSVDEVIENTQKKINKLQDLKKATMNELLTKGIGHTEFKDSELGRIPKSWEVLTFSESNIKVLDGDRGNEYPKEADFKNSGFCLFLSAKNVTKNGFRFDTTAFITKDKDERLRKGRLNPQDIVITTRGTVGNIAFYDDSVNFNTVRINSGMAIIRNNNAQIECAFIYKLLSSGVITTQLKNLTFGSAQPQLTIGTLNELRLPIPPLAEQSQIVSAITSIQIALDKMENKLSQAKSLKKSLMQDLLTGKVRVTVS